MKNVPAFICGCLDGKAKTTPGCSKAISLLIILLLVLETPEDPTSLSLQEVTVLVSLKSEDPSSGDPIPDMDFSRID